MRFFSRFFAFKEHLMKFSQTEKLSTFSLFLVILFDIFLFNIVGSGIENSSDSLTRPDSYMGYQCSSLIKEVEKISTNEDKRYFLGQIKNATLNNYEASEIYAQNSYGKGCANIKNEVQKLLWTGENTMFLQKYTLLTDIEKQLDANKSTSTKIRAEYDTKLLEKIANQPQDRAISDGSALDAKDRLQALDTDRADLLAQSNQTVAEIMSLPEVQKLTETLQVEGPKIMTEYAHLAFWYPVKVFGIQVLFLIPLFFFAYIWVSRSILLSSSVQTLVGSHVLAVLSCFGFIKVLQFVYDIIPHKFFLDIFNFLEASGLVSLWYYILALLGVLGCLLAIYVVQKKIFNPRKQQLKRLAQGKCFACGSGAKNLGEYCSSCGVSRFVVCEHCQKKTLAGGLFCEHCGGDLK